MALWGRYTSHSTYFCTVNVLCHVTSLLSLFLIYKIVIKMLSNKQKCRIYITNMCDLTEVHTRIYSHVIKWLKKKLFHNKTWNILFFDIYKEFSNLAGKINIKIVNKILWRTDNEEAVKLPGVIYIFWMMLAGKLQGTDLPG